MSLRVWLPLNGTLDNQGLDDVVVTNNGATVDNSGKIGKCYSFDGSNNYISFPYSFPSGDWSYSVWFYTTSTGTQTLGCCRNEVGLGFSIFLISYKVRIDGVIGSTNQQWITTYTYPTNTWINLIITSKNGLIKYYINGEYQTDKTIIVNNTKLGNVFTIGAGQTNGSGLGNYFKGKINDIRIYDHVLSPMEVKQISQGLILHYPLNNNGWGNENLHKNSDTITSTWIINQGTVSNGIATLTPSSGFDRRIYQMPANGGWSWESNKTYTASIDARSPDGATLIIYPYGAGSMHKSYTVTSSWKRYSFTFTATKSDTGSMTYHVNQTSGVILQLKHPKLELGQKATPWCPNEADELYTLLGLNNNIEYDTSGYGNNGMRVGTFSWTSDTPKYQVSTHAVGSNTTHLEGPPLPAEAKTVALWIKGNKSTNGAIFNDKISGLQIGLLNSVLYMNSLAATAGFTTTHWKNGQWNHVVAINNNGIRSLYVNGQPETQSGANNYYIHNADNFWLWNRSYNNTYAWTGDLSDFRVYTTALSIEDVKSLYNNSAYIDNQGNIYGAVYEEV